MAEKSKVNKQYIYIAIAFVVSLAIVAAAIFYVTRTVTEYKVTIFISSGKYSEEFVEKGHKIERPADPEAAEGYRFDTWFANEALSIEYDFDRPVNGDVTIYAKFVPQNFSAVYWSNFKGTEPNSQEFLRDPPRAYESNFSASTAVPIDPSGHYEFLCWADEPEIVSSTNTYDRGGIVKMPMGGINLYAIWQGVIQTVVFEYSAEAYSYGQQIGLKTDNSGRYGETYTLPNREELGSIDHKDFEKIFVGFYRKSALTGVVDTSRVYYPGSSINLLEDVVFVDAWEDSTGRVIFDLDYVGGTPPAAKKYVAGHRFNLPNSERPHYILSGWSDGKGSVFAPNTTFIMPESEVTLTAEWQERDYRISYDPNALVQGVMNSTTVRYGDMAIVPSSTFIYPGDKSEFKYWVLEENKDLTYEEIENSELTRYVAGDMISNISGDITLYAIWSPRPMSVAYKLTDTGAALSSMAYIESLFEDSEIRYGYYYDIPDYDASLIVHENNDKVFGGFKILNDPTGAVYQASDRVLVLGDTTLLFNWVSTGNDIVFELGGGYMQSVTVPSFVTGASFVMPSVPLPDRTNFEFRGWVLKSYVEEECDGVLPAWEDIPETWNNETVKFEGLSGLPFVMPEGGMIFVAVWRAAAYTIDFNRGLNSYIDGSMPRLYTVFGESFEVTNEHVNIDENDDMNSIVVGDRLKVGFSYYGYEFVGWSMRANQTNPDYSIGSRLNIDAGLGSRNLTLYPCFRSIGIVIKYDGSGGNFGGLLSIENTSYNFGQFIALNSAFNKENYEFVGWSVVPDADLSGYGNGDIRNVVSAGSTVLVDSLFITKLDELEISHFENGDVTITLYAIFRGARTNIVFSGNGGLGTMTAQNVRYGDTDVSLALNTFIRNGYEFMGWSSSADGDVEYADSEEIDVFGPITLYAKWRGVEVSVVIHLNDPDYSYEQETLILTQVDGVLLRFGDIYNFEDISSFVMINPNKEFFRYNTLASGTGASYYPSSPSVQDRSVTLGSVNNFYVIWEGKSKGVTYDLSDVRLDGGGEVGNIYATGEYNKAFRLSGINAFYQGYRHYSETEDGIVAGDVPAGFWISNIGSTSYNFVEGETAIYAIGSNILITDDTIVKIYWTTDVALAAAVVFDMNIAGDASLYPASINPITGSMGGSVTLPLGPTRNNYVFDGWNTKADCSGTAYNAAEIYNLESVTTVLYAVWLPKDKYIRYDANGGAFSGVSLDDGDYLSNGITVNSITLLESFTLSQLNKTDYELAGFSLSSQGNLGGQHVYASGAVFSMSESLFSNSGSEVTEVTLYAIWRGKSVSINFVGQSGTISSGSPTYTIGARVGDTVLIYNDFVRTGYDFKYFTQTPADSGTKYCVSTIPSSFNIQITTSGSVTLYAQWQPQMRTVMIKSDAEGTLSYEIEVPYAQTWIMFDPSSTTDSWTLPSDNSWTGSGRTFLGWKLGDVEYPWDAATPGEIIVTNNVDFVAMWSASPAVRIIFDRGSGVINGEDLLTSVLVEVVSGGEFTIPASVITYSGGTAQYSKEGFSFDGWTYNLIEFYAGENVMLNGSYFNSTDLEDYEITLTARFVSNKYTINYVAENGEFEAGYPNIVTVDPSVTPGDYQIYGKNAVSHLSGNFVLAGWDLMVGGAFDGVIDYSLLEIISTPAANLVLRAVWVPATKEVDIDSGEATFSHIELTSSEEDELVLKINNAANGLGGLYSPTFTAENLHYPSVSNSTAISIDVPYGSKLNVYGENNTLGGFWIFAVLNSSGYVTDIYIVEAEPPTVGLIAKTGKFFSADGGITKHAIGGVSQGGTAVVIENQESYTILWQGEERNIVFEGNGGYLGSHETVYTSVHFVGETITLANIFTKDNCTFDKWLYSNGATIGSETYINVGEDFTVDEYSYLHNGTDIVFVAQWKAASVYVTYFGNGGSIVTQITDGGTPSDVSDDIYSYKTEFQQAADIGLNVNYPVASSPFIYSGFQFLYWSTSDASDALNDGTKYYPGSATTGFIDDITLAISLYAIWGLPQYTLTFNDGNGTEISVQVRGGAVVPAPGVQFAGTLIDISNPYHRFVSWNTALNGTGITYSAGDSIEVNENITLYAIWEDIPVYVYFDPNGGTGTISYDPNSRVVGQEYITPELPEGFVAPNGKVFVGWSFNALALQAVAAGDPIVIDGNLVESEGNDYKIILYAIYS